MTRLVKNVAAVALLLAALPAWSQSVITNNPGTKGTYAIRNVTIVPVTSPSIARGTIVIAGGKITAILAADSPAALPENTTVIDGTGMFVYPGMIDGGTKVGLLEVSSVPGTNDVSEKGDFNPNARAIVAVNPHSNVIPVTRANGITAVITRPEGGVISGQDALIQLAGWTPDEMSLKAPVAMHINFPVAKTPSFDEPETEEEKKKTDKSYRTRLEQLEDILRDARSYGRALGAREKSPSSTLLQRDLLLQNLAPVAEGRVPVVMHANRAVDIRDAIRFADKNKLTMILAGGHDVRQVIPDLKSRNIPVILGPILALPLREDDPYDLLFTNALALHEAGIKFAFQTEDAHDVRNLPYHAAACVAFGLPKEIALKALTIYPAEIFGVADRMGSLEVGKRADLFMSDGDPLEIRTNIKALFIGGEPITLDTHQTLLYEKFKNRPKR